MPPIPKTSMNHTFAAIPFAAIRSKRSWAILSRASCRTLCVSVLLTFLCMSVERLGPQLHAQSPAPETDSPPSVATADEATPVAAADEPSTTDDLLRQMTTTGIQLTDDVSFPLPEPTFVSIAGELAAPEAARQALDEIAGPQGTTRFTRNSVVAPLSVQIDSIENEAGKRIGHYIDVEFVVHQSIAEIRQSEVLSDFKSDSETQSSAEEAAFEFADRENADAFEITSTRSLTAAERSQFDVRLDRDQETLGYLQLPLLGKVVLRGVARARRSVWSSDDESAPVILTWLLDSRFAHPSPQPDSVANQWRAIERTEVGKRVLGPPSPYAGMGGYVTITPLPGDPAVSLVQLRFVLHEPVDWFHGRNLLRSKLPLLIQDRVRNIRRELLD
ncbi:hypothetical protein [Allorhodopirellula solitaria]|uniref:Uncharacterized protein n=1 Tax=Allorhodopirellula solitaria TaxID=2527987 RepID=A0A5C5XBB1_9BACT|nr:hypothetical protein [Allorhodopirellula solitaria]TWT59182.1 hypothetical protein CA85_38780 [Allorhodopirellula solitaria]